MRICLNFFSYFLKQIFINNLFRIFEKLILKHLYDETIFCFKSLDLLMRQHRNRLIQKDDHAAFVIKLTSLNK